MFQLFHEIPEQHLSFLDKLEMEVFKAQLSERASDFNTALPRWKKQLEITQEDHALLIEGFYPNLFSDVLHDDFYALFYKQAIFWLDSGLSQNKALRLLDFVRAELLKYSDDLDSPALGAALSNFCQIGALTVRLVYDLSSSLEQIKQRSTNEIRRLRNFYDLLAHPAAEDVFDVCFQHQAWKELAFELALGRNADLQAFDPDHLKSRVAEWLEADGKTKIPEREIRQFIQAHEKVHLLGVMAVDASRNSRSKDIIALLNEMERNSQIVMDTLLDILERELVSNVNDDALKGFLNGNLLEIEMERTCAFAKRHDFWLDLIVVGLGDYKESRVALDHIAQAIKLLARTEDMLFYVEEQQVFVILSLGKETEGAHIFANRVFNSIEHDHVVLEDGRSVKIDIPCGALSYWAGLSLPTNDVMEALMHQLHLAESSPKASVKYTVLDVIKHPAQEGRSGSQSQDLEEDADDVWC
ncbi:hypothetical protein [Hydrogenovibrio marinus]|uniref:GGDEF domain-containing protein n=1 Tax=Hydrogenovibrio marinus TaxID=28885 RepID=A0A067A1K1_HYDMR|nr:hypothetical protein [Hydrogenovibrio marinus]KDN96501.1 hypothetical protein EI16_09570 [Hydrogenovibrio marinus]BBN60300.1 hypothetical protein HVMH_1894 [Hydrogenovibrio marinus]